MIRIISLLLILLFLPDKAKCQGTFIPLNTPSYPILERLEIKSGRISDQLHFSASPLLRQHVVQFIDSIQKDSVSLSRTDQKNIQNLLTDNDEWSDYAGAKSKKPLFEYFYRDKATLYQHRTNDFMIKVNPVFDFTGGVESRSQQKLFTNTRGIELRGWVTKKIGFYTMLTENQARLPFYVRERIDSFGAIPGEAYFKNFKSEATDFFTANAYIDFKLAKFITIQFGSDNNFIGNGNRSLALSDFSGDYLFLKLQTQVWKISYQNLFVDLTADFLRGGDRLLPKKYAAFHHLSLNATRFLNVGIWESVIFQRNNDFELQYLNPLIFYRFAEQLIGSADNAMLGIDYRLNFLRHFSLYGQMVIDDYNFQASKSSDGYWGNKYGLQTGVKYIDALGIDNLDLQLEWNHLRPYVYTHNDSIANYSNYNQPLAHPLGANLNEGIGIVRFQPFFPLTLQLRITVANQGRDTSNSNWGSNIFIPSVISTIETVYGNEVGQGVSTNLFLNEFSVSYMIRHNMFIDLKYLYRRTRSDVTAFSSMDNIFQIGIRINAVNKEYQF
jgi:hypothetical protein